MFKEDKIRELYDLRYNKFVDHKYEIDLYDDWFRMQVVVMTRTTYYSIIADESNIPKGDYDPVVLLKERNKVAKHLSS